MVAAIAGFGLLVVAIVYFAQATERRRGEEVRRLARRMGFSYQEKAEPPSAQGIGRFGLFKQGHGHTVRHLMKKADGPSRLALFEYAYTVGHGQHQSRWVQTVAAVARPGSKWPHFSLNPESVFSRIGAFFGAQDIDFDGNQEFSRAYVLKGEDEGVVRSLVSPDATHWLARRKGWSVEAQGEDLVMFRSAKRVKADDLADFVDEVEAFVETLR